MSISSSWFTGSRNGWVDRSLWRVIGQGGELTILVSIVQTREPNNNQTPLRGSSFKRVDRLAAFSLVITSAILSTMAEGAPTGRPNVDLVYRALLGASVAAAATRAKVWGLAVLASLAASTAGTSAPSGWLALGLLAGLVALSNQWKTPRAALGGLAIFALLNQHWGEFGQSALVTAGALVGLGLSCSQPALGLGRPNLLRAWQKWLIATVATAAVFGFGILLSSAVATTSSALGHADTAYGNLADGDSARANNELERAAKGFEQSEAQLNNPILRAGRWVPILGRHLDALSAASLQGKRVANDAQDLVSSDDYRGLTNGTGRLNLDRAQAFQAPARDTAQTLEQAAKTLQAIDRNWLFGPFRSKLDQRTDDVTARADDALIAAEVLEVLPGAFGAEQPKHYFVAFLNNAEQRGLGGLLGNYAEVEAVDGRLRLVRSGSAKDIENAVQPGTRHLSGPKEYLDRYARYEPADFVRDATFSPEFAYDASVITQLYEQSGFGHVDGVIALDVHALAAILDLTGPIEVPGLDKPLNSSNAVDVLLREQYLSFDDQQTRKDVLDNATALTFSALLTRPLPSPYQLITTLSPIVRQRRLMIQLEDHKAQQLMDRVGLSGRIPSPQRGEVFLLTHQNFGNNKLDALLERQIRYTANLNASDGSLTAAATVRLTNTAPSKGLPSYVIGNSRGLPTGTNALNVSFYSRLDLHSIRLDGQELPVEHGTEAGLNVYSFRVDVPPKSAAELEIKLTGKADLSSGAWSITYVPNASANRDEVGVTLNATEGELTLVGGSTNRRAQPKVVVPRSDLDSGKTTEVRLTRR